MITIDDLNKVDIRVGKIISCSLIPKEQAKYSTHKLEIDFGKELGVKKSCARLINYTLEELNNRLIIAVANLVPRQIGKNISEVLVIGTPDDKNECILIIPGNNAKIGSRVY